VEIYKDNKVGYVGKIPIRNLWLLMLYASDFYHDLDSSKIAFESNPDEIADLVAEILCRHVEKRLNQNLSHGYRDKVAEINRVRGRIEFLTTERKRLLDKGKICCRFQELTIDTPRNRYVRGALDVLEKIVVRNTLAHKCRNLSVSLERLGVWKEKPVNYNSSSERFGRHEIADRKMVIAADLAYSLLLPTEFLGQHSFSLYENSLTWLRKLFEKAIAGFYSVVLDKNEWQVSAGTRFNWQISSSTDKINTILPSMKTDIMLSRKSDGDKLIIDTKFNSITTSGWYRPESIRSGYIYQIYAYLRSQEIDHDANSLNSCGMLLHPSIGNEFDESVTIQGHKIRFCTVNLAQNPIEIRNQLIRLIEDNSYDS